jgi:uncharacterized protein (TIGR03382 family)
MTISSAEALACQCSADGPAYSAEVARRDAAVIFEGRVKSEGPADEFRGLNAVVLTDLKFHRGSLPLMEITLQNGLECARAQTEVGKRFLVYLRREDVRRINACSRVVPVSAAAAEIAALEPAPSASPSPPAPAPSAETPPAEPVESTAEPDAPRAAPTSGGCASCSTQDGGPSVVPFAWLGAAAWLLRRRRGRVAS